MITVGGENGISAGSTDINLMYNHYRNVCDSPMAFKQTKRVRILYLYGGERERTSLSSWNRALSSECALPSYSTSNQTIWRLTRQWLSWIR